VKTAINKWEGIPQVMMPRYNCHVARKPNLNLFSTTIANNCDRQFNFCQLKFTTYTYIHTHTHTHTHTHQAIVSLQISSNGDM
jgi:hypothetical protein